MIITIIIIIIFIFICKGMHMDQRPKEIIIDVVLVSLMSKSILGIFIINSETVFQLIINMTTPVVYKYSQTL